MLKHSAQFYLLSRVVIPSNQVMDSNREISPFPKFNTVDVVIPSNQVMDSNLPEGFRFKYLKVEVS
ncbi:hypothetical protein Flexsi_1594 [Flexistipes sinusarabici DSM 4947]|uniref:Uncharacterized protein n=2 Tax=Flexistipes sinusarabici TaxID=2352 RepID=F8E942_FLESM|nr:hypothetical protein Flexsi_1594 [Flexistipes sinusarabici DSM 4947]